MKIVKNKQNKSAKINKSYSILLVDDDSCILQMLGFILSKIGFKQILKATSAESALRILHSNPVDIIFLDINMKGMCGIESIHKIKLESPKCKIIMLSGNATMDNVNASISKGADGFISKPFNAEKIIHAITTVHKIKRLDQDNINKDRN